MGMESNRMIKYFKEQGGVVRFSSIKKAGFHHATLEKLNRDKIVEKIGSGLYRLSEDSMGSYPDYVIASLQTSKGVICLLSALYFYGVTNEIPRFVDIAIPSGARANKIKYPPVKFYRFSLKSYNAGIVYHDIGGHKIKVYDLAKTIADCFKFRNRIGTNVVRDALKTAILEKKVRPNDIMKYAKVCRMDRVIKPVLEAML